MRHLLMLSTLLAVTTSALAQEPLTIYTYDSFASDWGPGPKIKKAFEKEKSLFWPASAMILLSFPYGPWAMKNFRTS